MSAHASTVVDAAVAESATDGPGERRHWLHGPIYPRLLRLHHVHPSAWQRALLVEGTLVVGALVALADKVTAWAPLILLVAVAVIVKFHDLLTGVLRPQPREQAPEVSAVPSRASAPSVPEPASSVRLVETAAGRQAVRVADRAAARVAAAATRAAERAEASAAQQAADLLAAAEADLDTLQSEATELATELLTLDGEVHPFAVALEPDGDVTLVTTEAAYDRVPDALRVAALWDELRRLAADGAVRAAAVGVAQSGGVRLEVECPGAAPRVVQLPQLGARRLGIPRRSAGVRSVQHWS